MLRQFDSTRGRRARAIASVLIALAGGSCAYHCQQADGTRRIIGFVDMEIRPPADPRTVAGEVVEVSAIGLSLLKAHEATSVALGWQRHLGASLRNNALVLGNPLTALDRPADQHANRGIDDATKE